MIEIALVEDAGSEGGDKVFFIKPPASILDANPCMQIFDHLGDSISLY